MAGVDEAGRGPLAGPVCAAAVVLDLDRVPAGLDDSKRLAPDRRAELFDAVAASALAIAVSFASPDEIDRLNIRQATHAAMRRALAALATRPGWVLVDGNDLPPGLLWRGAALGGEAIIGGDGLSASIAAASIVAKVSRDRLMRRAALVYPAYGFERHVGYPTREHLAALASLGPCRLHRRSFAPLRHLATAAAALSEKSTAFAAPL